MSNSTKTVILSPKEIDVIIEGLLIRKNLIETGNASTSATDIAAMGETVAKQLKLKLRPLSSEQMRMCIFIDDLIKKIEE